jgi:hypothetical protein
LSENGEGLDERLKTAEQFSAEMARQIEAGDAILARLAQIASAGRPATAAAPDAKAVVAAAQAFAARAQSRVNGLAA